MKTMFQDRVAAGRQLGERLRAEALAPPLVVVALPRGGVPVAAEVARCLGAPLDLLIVRKIGAPCQRELAVAAVTDGDAPGLVVDERTSAATGADTAYLEREARIEWREIERRRALYLRGRAPLSLAGVTAVVVDDGIATGTTARAAVLAMRRRGAARVVLAAPVAAHEAVMDLCGECDRVVCLAEPQPFRAVGSHYADFHQLSDEEVIAAIDAAQGPSMVV
jgi:putative phosphoribosyl transferase